MELQLYIANLGKYNEGILQGEWFSLPVDFQDVAARIGLNEEYEEYAIHDYEAPFKISEYANIDSLNEIAEKLISLDEIEGKALGIIMDLGYDFETAFNTLENDVIWYDDCRDMSEVAERYCEECDILNGMPERLQSYFDYESFGRDMYIEGEFHELGKGYWIQILL